MNLDGLEKWNDDFDNGLIDVSQLEHITLSSIQKHTLKRGRFIDFTVDEILAMPLSMLLEISKKKSEYLAYKRAVNTNFCDLYDKAEKSKGRYLNGRISQEIADLELRVRLENAKAKKPSPMFLSYIRSLST
jgi:hypothetical protein